LRQACPAFASVRQGTPPHLQTSRDVGRPRLKLAFVKFYVAHCCLCNWSGGRVVDSRRAPSDSPHPRPRQASTCEVISLLQALPALPLRTIVTCPCSLNTTHKHNHPCRPNTPHHVRAVFKTPYHTCRLEHVALDSNVSQASGSPPDKPTLVALASQTRVTPTTATPAQHGEQYKLDRPNPRSPADA
jgi:hypothetical protein